MEMAEDKYETNSSVWAFKFISYAMEMDALL